MKVQSTEFGVYQGKVVNAFTLINDNGMKVTLLSLGGIIHDIQVPDRAGQLHACVQSLPDLHAYIDDPSYKGAIVGRFANRIGNATFTLDNAVYKLDKNGGEHNLHGGIAGFHKKVWQSKVCKSDSEASVHFSLSSEDGEGGFPGNVEVTAVYTLSNDNALLLELHATTDKATPLSLTQHAYFTLSKQATVGTTEVQIHSQKIADVDSTLLPTGHYVDVANTPFDFSQQKAIETQSNKSHPLYELVCGYDHNYVLLPSVEGQPQAKVASSDTGICMSLYTDLPGLQFYTGSLQSTSQLGALCLEPQYFPDSPNRPEFPDCIATPEAPYKAYIRYTFEHI